MSSSKKKEGGAENEFVENEKAYKSTCRIETRDGEGEKVVIPAGKTVFLTKKIAKELGSAVVLVVKDSEED